jgi:long-chain acyl-CoA synthetase
MHTIDALIRESCRRHGDKAALRHKVAGVWHDITYRDLWQLSDRIAAGLIRAGFTPGSHGAILAPSSPHWVAACLGVLKAGGVAVPVDKELKSAELRHVLTDSDTRVVFGAFPFLEPVLEMMPDIPALRQVVVLPSPGTAAETLQSRLVREGRLVVLDDLCHSTPPPEGLRKPDDTAVILYTSGTTGRAKGAMLSHANIVSNIQGAIGHFRLDDSIHTLSFLPINHVFELVCGILLPLSLGGTVSFCESLKKLGENLAEVRPSFLLGVPAVFRMILDRVMKAIDAKRLSRFLFSLPLTRPLVAARVRRAFGAGTIFVSGGAALDPAVAEGLPRLGLTICQGYGITETSPVISAEQPGATRPGSVGRLLHGVALRIDKPNEDGVGELLVKGPNVMQGYYKSPQATAEAIEEGWYRTGDLGRLDDDGFLTIHGRVKNVIVTPNGKNVYPEEVENELLKSPFIAEAMVYGHRLAPKSEEVHAIVHPDQEALDNHCRDRGACPLSDADVEAILRREIQAACGKLADYKRVRRFTVREDEFPKTTTRKIKRFAVEADISTGS